MRLYIDVDKASTAVSPALRHNSRISLSLTSQASQRRNASVLKWFKGDKKKPALGTELAVEDLLKGHRPPKQDVIQQGGLEDDSILGPEETKESGPGQRPEKSYVKDVKAMAAALDPKPWARAQWQRKKVIQGIQHRGRISRTQQILKQERHHMHGSDFFKTSVKKTMPLTRQIAGKSVEDALVQLRFSKKLAARRIEEELKIARDEAIVSKGMGLGQVSTEGEGIPQRVVIKDKNGATRTVQPTAMYIDQAWVNKRKSNRSVEYRARGRRNILQHPHTSKLLYCP